VVVLTGTRFRAAPRRVRIVPMDAACEAAAAVVLALHGTLHVDPETAAGLAHFYAATAACSAPERVASRKAASPPFSQWIQEILLRQPGIDPDRWLVEHPVRGVRGEGAKLFMEPPGCPRNRLTLLSSSNISARAMHGDVAHKVVCDAHATLDTAPCRVISVGSDGDVAFEDAVHRRWPLCAIDVFDGTLTGPRAFLRHKLPSYVKFLPNNFGPQSWQTYDGQTVAVLKIDCERCEHDSLLPWLKHVCTQQILVEVHPQGHRDDGNRTARLLAAISQTHAPFFAVHNHHAGWRKGRRFAEIAWKRRQPCTRASMSIHDLT
jgi:hypothetical protein